MSMAHAVAALRSFDRNLRPCHGGRRVAPAWGPKQRGQHQQSHVKGFWLFEVSCELDVWTWNMEITVRPSTLTRSEETH